MPVMSSSEYVEHNLPLSYYKKRKSSGSGPKTSILKAEEDPMSSKMFSTPVPASSKSKVPKTAAGPMSFKRTPNPVSHMPSKQNPQDEVVGGSSLTPMSKFNLHLQSSRRKIGHLSIVKGYEEYLVKSTFTEMFLCKDGVKEEKEETDADEIGSSKTATDESNFTSLQEDLEFSSSDDDDSDKDDDDVKNSDSDTSSGEGGEELRTNDKPTSVNNNDGEASTIISSDSEDEEERITTARSSIPRIADITERIKCFYDYVEGEGIKRKVRCKLCPGMTILQFKSFHQHIKNVHENHERQKCELCHKNFAYSHFQKHRKDCQKRAAWSQIELNEVN